MNTATDSGTPARAWLPDAATARYQRAKRSARGAMPHGHGCCCSSLLTQPFSRRLEPHIPHDVPAIGVYSGARPASAPHRSYYVAVSTGVVASIKRSEVARPSEWQSAHPHVSRSPSPTFSETDLRDRVEHWSRPHSPHSPRSPRAQSPPPPLTDQQPLPPPALRSPSRPQSAARPVPRSAAAALRAGPRTTRGGRARAARPTTPRQSSAASAQFGEARETTALALQGVQRALAMADERVGALQRENELLLHTLGACSGGGSGSGGGQSDRAELAARLRDAHQKQVAPAEYDRLKQRLLREYFGVS